jgi:hypothetical protein
MPFWIDTMCIPEPYDLRKRAIGQMRRIFKDARAVLVLDAELCRTSSKVEPAEAFHRIMISNWSTRLWTLQEVSKYESIPQPPSPFLVA